MRYRIANRIVAVLIFLSLLFGGVAEYAKAQDKGCTHSQEQIKALRKARKKLTHRKRRIIVNDDGNQTVYSLKEATREAFLKVRTSGLEGTGVDTICYCSFSAGFCMFTHNTKVGEIFDCTASPAGSHVEGGFVRNKTADFIAQGTDCLEMQVDFCHENGIEIFWSMRMNDTHDGGAAPLAPYGIPQLKRDHPDWLIWTDPNNIAHVRELLMYQQKCVDINTTPDFKGREWRRITNHWPKCGSWTAVNYAVPEIRDLAFRYVEEVCENYDINGIELDFFRHPVFFASHAWGKEVSQQECDMMTDMVRRIRKMTERVALQRGRPILVMVRVPDSVGWCKAIGLDIERWMKEGLIDMLVTTGYFRLNNWQYSVELGHKYNVPVYPCLSDSRVKGEEARKVRRSVACYRSRAMNVWNSGADGVYLFNYGDVNSPLWNEMGDPKVLETTDKVYCTGARGFEQLNIWIVNGRRFVNRPFLAPEQPVTLQPGQTETVELRVGQDLLSRQAEGIEPEVKLQLQVEKLDSAEDIFVKLNDNQLTDGTLSGSRLEYSVNPATVKKGINLFKFTLKADCKAEVVLEDILLWVRYDKNKLQTDNAEHNQQQLEQLRQARKKLAHRKRRIIVNDDGNPTVYSLKEANREELLSKRSVGLPGTQVDTLFYCSWSSGFGMFTHNTKVGQVFDTKACPSDTPDGIGFSKNKAGDFIKQGTDCLQIQIDFCRKNNIEIFWSIRMNDTHDGADKWWYHPYMFPKLKSEHPEWLIGSRKKKPPRGSWTAVDYAKPEIRDLAYRYVEEVCENYDIDGVELDFFRHLVYFRSHAWGSGAGQKERDMMTDMMRRIREMTERIGIKRGKPILVSVRVPDSVGYCNAMGIDIERWLKEALVDMLMVTGYFRLNDWQYSVELGHKYDVPVYPCLSDPRIGPAESSLARKSMDCYRARAMNVWASGADGVYIFNYCDPNSCLWNQIGEPGILEKLNKVYCISARSVAVANSWLKKGWSRFLNRPWWGPNGPLPLREGEVIIFYLDVGEDISNGVSHPSRENVAKGIVPDVKLRLNVKNIPGAKVLTVVLNNHVLENRPLSSETTLSDKIDANEWFEYDVEPSIVKKGANRIKLTLWECGAKNPALADVLLWVRYPGTKGDKVQ